MGLVKQLAFELAPDVRVNGVAPGGMPSDLRGPRALGLADTSWGSMPVDRIMERFSPLERAIAPADYTGHHVLLAFPGELTHGHRFRAQLRRRYRRARPARSRNGGVVMTAADEATLGAIADELRAAYDTYQPIKPVRDRLDVGGIDAAYAVQQRNTDYWVAQGRRIVGRKIGLTSEAVQRQLGVDQPDFGALLDDMRLYDGDTIPYRAVLQPRIEAEVALVLSGTLDDEDLTLEQLTAAVDHVLPALEVVGSRITGWDITILDTIADNASSGMFVLGTTPVDPTTVDLSAASMTLTLDGAVASTGSGAACLGHPYSAALWLARRMALEGTPLRAGDVVMTGALGPMVDLATGAEVQATIGGLGTVRTSRERKT